MTTVNMSCAVYPFGRVPLKRRSYVPTSLKNATFISIETGSKLKNEFRIVPSNL